MLTLAGGYYLNDSIDGKLEGAYKDYTVTPLVQYSFSCLYKVEVGTLSIRLYDQTNNALLAIANVTDTVWTAYDVNITIPTAETAGLKTSTLTFTAVDAIS